VRLTATIISRAMKLQPGRPTDRVVFDPNGIHHKTIPAQNLIHSVANHERAKNMSVAESLYMMRKLKDIGAVRQSSSVLGQGAVLQAFHGKAGYEACHAMPCQLVVDHSFPHALKVDGKLLNASFLQRTLTLFGRCTWQPKIVNAIDAGLEWTPQDGRPAGFVSAYLDSVQAVLHGQSPSDAYRDYAKARVMTLRDLLDRVRDEPFNTYDATLLMSGLYRMTSDDVRRLHVDAHTASEFELQRELVVETILQQDQVIPHEIVSGELGSREKNGRRNRKTGNDAVRRSFARRRSVNPRAPCYMPVVQAFAALPTRDGVPSLADVASWTPQRLT